MEAGPTDITNDQKNLILAKISDMCGRQARAGGRRHPIVLALVENNRPLSPHCTETKDWFKYSSWYWSGPGHVTLRQRQQEIWLPDRSEPSKEGAGGSLGRQQPSWESGAQACGTRPRGIRTWPSSAKAAAKQVSRQLPPSLLCTASQAAATSPTNITSFQSLCSDTTNFCREFYFDLIHRRTKKFNLSCCYWTGGIPPIRSKWK